MERVKKKPQNVNENKTEQFISERRGSDPETLKQNRDAAAETIKKIPEKIKKAPGKVVDSVKQGVVDTAKGAGAAGGAEFGNQAGSRIQSSIERGAENATNTAVAGSKKISDNLSKGVGKAALYTGAAVVGTKLASKAIDRVLPDKKKKKTKKEDYSDWRNDLTEDDMKGMSVKSGHKRPTKSGAGMTQKGVEAYRRRNPGSKLKTAVTTKPSKLKKGSKAANRRKSYCARSAGQMKKFPKAAKDPNSRLRQARRRWNC